MNETTNKWPYVRSPPVPSVSLILPSVAVPPCRQQYPGSGSWTASLPQPSESLGCPRNSEWCNRTSSRPRRNDRRSCRAHNRCPALPWFLAISHFITPEGAVATVSRRESFHHRKGAAKTRRELRKNYEKSFDYCKKENWTPIIFSWKIFEREI